MKCKNCSDDFKPANSDWTPFCCEGCHDEFLEESSDLADENSSLRDRVANLEDELNSLIAERDLLQKEVWLQAATINSLRLPAGSWDFAEKVRYDINT